MSYTFIAYYPILEAQCMNSCTLRWTVGREAVVGTGVGPLAPSTSSPALTCCQCGVIRTAPGTGCGCEWQLRCGSRCERRLPAPIAPQEQGEGRSSEGDQGWQLLLTPTDSTGSRCEWWLRCWQQCKGAGAGSRCKHPVEPHRVGAKYFQ